MLQIAEEVGISSGNVSKILHNSLGIRNVSARWVPHMLTGEKRRAECADAIPWWKNLTEEDLMQFGR